MPAARRLFALLSPLLVGALACASAPPGSGSGSSSASPSAHVEAEPGTPAPADGVTILIDPGAEPRAPLRYHPRVGERIGWTMTTVMDTTVSLLGSSTQSQFGIAFDCVTEVVAVDDVAQEHEFVSTFVDARLLSVASDPAAVEAAVAPYLALEYRTRTNPLGEPLEVRYTRNGEPVDPTTLKSLDSFTAALTFPAEPVGVGARWRSYSELERNGFRVLQASEHRLVARDGDRVALETTVTQQPLSNVMRHPDAHVQLRRFDSAGTGRSTHDLGTPVPVTTEIQVTVTMGAVIIAGEEQTEMGLQMSLATTIERRP